MPDLDLTSSSSLTVADAAIPSTTAHRPKTINLLALKDYIVALGASDTTLRTLLGGPKRIFSYYQPDAIIDATHPAYITYAMTTFPEIRSAVAEPIFSLLVWALNLETAHAVRDRLVQLLQETPFVVPGFEADYIWGSLAGERDSYQENTKFTGLALQFRFGFSKV